MTTDTITRLQEAIEAAVAPILAENDQMLSEWLCIISTIGTAPGDNGRYLWVGTPGMMPHSRLGLAQILHDDVGADD